jgi:hypothetical protein
VSDSIQCRICFNRNYTETGRYAVCYEREGKLHVLGFTTKKDGGFTDEEIKEFGLPEEELKIIDTEV